MANHAYALLGVCPCQRACISRICSDQLDGRPSSAALDDAALPGRTLQAAGQRRISLATTVLVAHSCTDASERARAEGPRRVFDVFRRLAQCASPWLAMRRRVGRSGDLTADLAAEAAERASRGSCPSTTQPPRSVIARLTFVASASGPVSSTRHSDGVLCRQVPEFRNVRALGSCKRFTSQNSAAELAPKFRA